MRSGNHGRRHPAGPSVRPTAAQTETAGARWRTVPSLEFLEDRTLLSFAPFTSHGVGERPEGIVVGDFTGDGILDLAVPNNLTNTVTLLLGNGDGTFHHFSDTNVGGAPHPLAAAAGDFDLDGDLDLAVTTYSGGVRVLLGNGDGTFQLGGSFGPNNADSIAVGDFNGDGIPDLAVTTSNGVGVLLGNGDGSFRDTGLYLVSGTPHSVVVADFNGDGVPDLAVTNASGGVSVLLGNGDGSFRGAVFSVSGPSPDALAVGDFNGDGTPDLAVASGDSVRVLLGNGDGTFQDPLVVFAGPQTQSVAVDDLNGDGIPDLVTANQGNHTVTALLGNGDGTFVNGGSYDAGPYAFAVATGDFHLDGFADVATVNGSQTGYVPGTVSVLLNQADWNSGPTGGRATARSSPPDPTVLDPDTLAALSHHAFDTPPAAPTDALAGTPVDRYFAAVGESVEPVGTDALRDPSHPLSVKATADGLRTEVPVIDLLLLDVVA